jgi:hypothetical protein
VIIFGIALKLNTYDLSEIYNPGYRCTGLTENLL